MKPDHLFVYGTLLPGLVPDEIKNVVEQLTLVGAGWARGRLYDLGAYPGAVLDEASHTKIIGKVFSLPADDERLSASLLERLDAYEGYTPEDETQNLFIRKLARITFLNGAHVECWIYVYNGNPQAAELIPDGNYAKRKPPDESA